MSKHLTPAGAEALRAKLNAETCDGPISAERVAELFSEAFEQVVDGTNVHHIQDRDDLERFRRTHGIRSDWHEPDEQEITATVIGHSLDTASTHVDDVYDHDESHHSLTVVLHEQVVNEDSVVTGPGQPLAYVNLAQLLSWGCNFDLED